MPWFVERRDPFWDVQGQNARRTRTRQRIVATMVVALSATILVLILDRLFTVDAGQILVGPGRPLVFSALVADVLACALILARELTHRVPG